LRTIEQPILRHAAAIHYTSKQEQVEAEALGACAPGKVIPLGVDLSLFQDLPNPAEFFERHPSAAGRPVVLFLSRLDPKKGLDLLLPAFAHAASVHTQAVLVIAGDGDARFVDACRRDAVRLGIDDRVIWCGFIAGREKLAALAAATVFVLPSYSENFGIAAVEALASGRACVLSDGVGIAAEVQERSAGLVVTCQTPALAAALERLLGDDVLRQQLSANARLLAADRFSAAAASARLKDLYANVQRAQPSLQNRVLTSATRNHSANPDV
jgi:glycosyltransferase involved in cell wall biosynthesis